MEVDVEEEKGESEGGVNERGDDVQADVEEENGESV